MVPYGKDLSFPLHGELYDPRTVRKGKVPGSVVAAETCPKIKPFIQTPCPKPKHELSTFKAPPM